MNKIRATKDNPNAEGDCDKCPDKATCPLFNPTAKPIEDSPEELAKGDK